MDKYKIGDFILYKGWFGAKLNGIINAVIGDYFFISNYDWRGDKYYIGRHCTKIHKDKVIGKILTDDRN